MISSYPKYEKNYIFTKEEKEIDKILEFITMFRTKKLELNVGSNYEVINNIKDEKNIDLILSSLKIKDKLIEKTDKHQVKVELDNLSLEIVYDNTKNKEEETQKLLLEKEKLISSIERRKKLLSNENYVNKAPENIVNKEKEDLQKEEKQLELINTKLENN